VFYYLFGTIAVISVLWSLISIRSNINRIHTQAFHININGTPLWTFSEKQAWEIKEFFPKVEEDLHGEKNVFVYPYAPLLYVFLDINNPTKYDYILIRLGIAGANSYVLYDIIKELQKKHVQYLIKHGWPEHYTQMLMALKHITPYPTVLDEFVKSHYTELWTIGEYGIFGLK
jgi:hypothetical protein